MPPSGTLLVEVRDRLVGFVEEAAALADSPWEPKLLIGACAERVTKAA